MISSAFHDAQEMMAFLFIMLESRVVVVLTLDSGQEPNWTLFVLPSKMEELFISCHAGVVVSLPGTCLARAAAGSFRFLRRSSGNMSR